MFFNGVKRFGTLLLIATSTWFAAGCGRTNSQSGTLGKKTYVTTPCSAPVTATFSQMNGSEILINRDYMWKLEVSGGCGSGYRATISGVANPISFRTTAYFTRNYSSAGQNREMAQIEVFDANGVSLGTQAAYSQYFTVLSNSATSPTPTPVVSAEPLRCTITPTMPVFTWVPNGTSLQNSVEFRVAAYRGSAAKQSRILNNYIVAAHTQPMTILPTDYATTNTAIVYILRAPFEEFLGINVSVEEKDTGALTQCVLNMPVIGSAPAEPAVPPVVNLTASQNGQAVRNFISIPSGGSYTLSWAPTPQARYCQILENGVYQFNAISPYSYTWNNITTPRDVTVRCYISAAPSDIMVWETISIGIAAPPPVGRADIKVNGTDGPVYVEHGATVNLSWSATDVTSCNIAPLGRSDANGSAQVSLTTTTTYTISCTYPTGIATDLVTVNVAEANYHLLFVSSELFYGDLGGLAGADAKCQRLADASGLMPGKTFKAILGAANTTPKNRISITKRVVRACTDRKQLGANASGFWDGKWDNAALCSENKVSVSAASVWTSVTQSGYSHGLHCRSWTSSSRLDSAYVGDGNDAGYDHFVNSFTAVQKCDRQMRLYCISQ